LSRILTMNGLCAPIHAEACVEEYASGIAWNCTVGFVFISFVDKCYPMLLVTPGS
jgi:hypothetical protein